jgi:hypothetical protein
MQEFFIDFLLCQSSDTDSIIIFGFRWTVPDIADDFASRFQLEGQSQRTRQVKLPVT